MNTTVRFVSILALAGLCAAPARAGLQDHLGLQLWSLREQFKENPAHALDLARSYGITEVETAGTAGMTAEAFRAELDARGLHAIGAHVQYADLEKDPAAVVRTVQTLGAKLAIVPWIPHEGTLDAATAGRAAANFNAWGALFRTAGIRFGYHPHGYEFVPGSKPGGTLFDDLVRDTRPEDVVFEMDLFWVIAGGGGDPVKLLEKYPTRWVALHVKDVRPGVVPVAGNSRAPATDKVAVGAGTIDWPALLAAADKIGIDYYIIEDETPAPLECIPASLEFLRGLKPD